MVFDIDICVITVEVKSLLVLIGWTDDASKIDVITAELWSEIDDDVAVWVVVICVDNNDELSIELETPLIVVVTNSGSGEDVAVSTKVAYECIIVDNDKYSPVLDVSSMVPNVVSLLVLEIPFVVVEINWAVDRSDSIDEVWSLWEFNAVVNTEVSDEIDSLFDEVLVAMDNSSRCV
jgi:hypothetical protein